MRSPVITELDRLLLQASLRDCRETVEASFRAWRSQVDPSRMSGRDVRLMPTLLANLLRFGIEDDSLSWLRGQAKHVWLTGAIRLRAFERALDVLRAADVPVVLLKGVALLARWREAVEDRPMGDFDILVPVERVRDALGALRERGLGGPAPEALGDEDLRRHHALGIVDRAGNNIDLHWRPAEAVDDPAFAIDLAGRSVDGILGARTVRVPGLADHLFILLAHAHADTSARRYDWVAEAALLFRRGTAAEWDWLLFRSRCGYYGLWGWAREALSLVAEVSGIRRPARILRHPAWSSAGTWRRALESARRELGAARPDGRQPDTAIAFPGGSCARVDPARLARVEADGFDLSRDAPGTSFLGGWSLPEPNGRWTDGEAATAALRIAGGRESDLYLTRLHLRAYRPPQIGPLHVDAWAGSGPVTWTFEAREDFPRHCILEGRLRACGPEAVLPISLRFRGLASLDERIRHGLDARSLGVFVHRIEPVTASRFPVLDGQMAFHEPSSDLAAWAGWAPGAPSGRWSLGPEAQIRLRLPEPSRHQVRAIRILVTASFSPSGSAQQVHASVNGEPALRASLNDGHGGPRGLQGGGVLDVDIPASALGSEEPLDLRLGVAEPGSPLSIGMSRDARPLGIAVTTIAALS